MPPLGIDFDETGETLLEFSAKYYYQFVASNGLTLIVLRDEKPPTKTDGVGGWNVVNRRRRKGLTTWGGRNPIRMDVPILFDGWTADPPYSVDAMVSTLNQMAIGDNFVIPPTVKVEGYLPVNGVVWVIEDITWGDNQVWIQSDAGDTIRVRQDAIVKLLQYVEEDVVRVSNLGQTPTSNAVAPYKTRPGDTARIIARNIYGNGLMWKKIRDLNPSIVRGPDERIASKQTLQMPPRNA